MRCPPYSACWNTKRIQASAPFWANWLFGYTHPYPDGNGRMARFTMNVMLASGGYPWTVVGVDDRDGCLFASDRASIDLDIVPFARLVGQRVRWCVERAATVNSH